MAWVRTMIGSGRTVPLAVLGLLAAWTVVAPSPWVPAGDSGELAAAAWNLGIPHNPGYPLFVILGKAFATCLPLGSIAMRVALLSGLCTLAAAATLLLVLLPRLVNGGAAFLSGAAVLVGLSLLSGRYRGLFREGEVYGCALLLLLLLAAVAVSRAGAGERRAPLLGLLAGIAILGHYQAAVSVAIMLVGLWASAAGALAESGRRLARGIAAALVVAPVLLFLSLRSAADPLPDWGNAESWGNLLFHVTGGEHLGTRLGLAATGRRAIALGADLAIPWGWWLCAGAVGVALAARRRRPLVPVAAVAAGEVVYALWLNRVEPEITPFLLATGLLVAGFAGAGLVAVGRFAGRGRGVVVALALAIPAGMALSSPAFYDRDLPCAADPYAQLRAERLAGAVPPGGIAVVSGDATSFPLAYLQGVGSSRPDLTVIDRTNSVFRYPGWRPAKIDGESRRAVEEGLLAEERPIIALGIIGIAEFGPARGAGEGDIVPLAGAARPALLPDPLPLLGVPAAGMTRRTVAEGLFLSLADRTMTVRERVRVLARIARWGANDPYLVNEAGTRLFGAGDRSGAAAVLEAGARRFPDVPELRGNLDAVRAAGSLPPGE